MTAYTPSYGAAPRSDAACLQENIVSLAPPVPPHILGSLVRIYNELGDLIITPQDGNAFLLSDTQTIRMLLETHLTDPDEREDALNHVLPYYEDFWAQRRQIENGWSVMTDAARRQALLNTTIGLKTIDQIFAEGFLDRIATTFAQPDAFAQAIEDIRQVLGPIEMQDFETAYDTSLCGVTQQTDAPAETPDLPAQTYDHLLLG